jgi:hypothetical protein
MLSRTQYAALQIGGAIIGLAVIVAGSWLVDHFVAIGWLKWLLGAFAVACGQTANWLFAGTYSSYRKYAAAHGGPDLPPSQFWATTGQAVVLIGSALLLTVLTHAAGRAPDGDWLRTAAWMAWIAIPGATMVYCLIARDWRRELTSRRMLSNER